MLSPTCAECDYPRTGLAPEAPCPECGTVPDRHQFLLRGWASPGSAVVPLALGTALLLLGASMWMPQAAGSMQPAYVLVAFGGFQVAVGLLRWRARDHGGDRRWLLTQAGVRTQGRAFASELPWTSIRRVRIQRLFLSRWMRIDIHLRPFAFAIDAPRLYVRQRDLDLDGLVEAVRRWSEPQVRSWWW